MLFREYSGVGMVKGWEVGLGELGELCEGRAVESGGSGSGRWRGC